MMIKPRRSLVGTMSGAVRKKQQEIVVPADLAALPIQNAGQYGALADQELPVKPGHAQ